MLSEIARASDALYGIPADLPRKGWVRAGMAAQAAGLEFDTFNAWSAQADNYKEPDARATWESFKPGKGVGAGTLFKMAAEYGMGMGMGSDRPERKVRTGSAGPPPKRVPRRVNVDEVYSRFEPATNSQPYIVAKGAAGVPLDGLGVVPLDDGLTIQGERMAGSLVVPVLRADDTVSSLQFVTLPEVAARLKAKGRPGKLNLPGPSMEGWFTVGKLVPGGVAYIVEGIGAAWSCWQATGQAAIVCFGWGRVRSVAAELRARDVTARLVLVPDVGKESEAAEIAQEVGAAVVNMPEGWPQNSDVNDFAQRDGMVALALLLEGATEPPIVYPLSVAFADELPDTYTPPDELVQGVLTVGGGSLLFGDSNTSKTFLVIDMGAAVARGVDWMGRKTEPGLVVYLAAESPASVRGRLQAYQKHHGVKVPNFAIVQSPIDLFDGDCDTDKVIKLVRMLEAKYGQPVRLIIGDTLARLSAGANENAGQDMGLVVRRFDRIRNECNTHFLLVHHSGKNAAAGSRGWSGIRAAVDTEIEVTDSPAGKCFEITKQRDLPTKGERIGFRLDVVTLGCTKWGAPATSCVVAPSDAPVKQKGKRINECEGAVLEFLVFHKIGIRKRDVVSHFEGRYEKGPIYRAMKALVTAAAVHEAADMVCATGVAK